VQGDADRAQGIHGPVSDERRKPAIDLFEELTVEQARSIAQDWLAEVRRGQDPSALKAAARQAPTVKELCVRFIKDYSKTRNKPSRVASNQKHISLHIERTMGSMKVPDVTRQDVVALIMKRDLAVAVEAYLLSRLEAHSRACWCSSYWYPWYSAPGGHGHRQFGGAGESRDGVDRTQDSPNVHAVRPRTPNKKPLRPPS
jgi:hypothetical protein